MRIPELQEFRTVERIVRHVESIIIDDESTLVGWRVSEKKDLTTSSGPRGDVPIWLDAKPPRSVRSVRARSARIPIISVFHVLIT